MTTTTKTLLLETDALHWGPPGRPDLFVGASFRLYAGDRAFLTGESGSGKSTLLRLIVMLEARRGGTVRWRGVSIDGSNIRRFRRAAVYVHQRPTTIGRTVHDNLAFAREVAGERAASEEETRALMDHLGLSEIPPDQDFTRLSGGEQQRVCLARAMTVNPEILLLDEPTSSLDTESQARVESALRRWVDGASERALIWVSHSAEQVARLQTRAIPMASFAAPPQEAR